MGIRTWAAAAALSVCAWTGQPKAAVYEVTVPLDVTATIVPNYSPEYYSGVTSLSDINLLPDDILVVTLTGIPIIAVPDVATQIEVYGHFRTSIPGVPVAPFRSYAADAIPCCTTPSLTFSFSSPVAMLQHLGSPDLVLTVNGVSFFAQAVPEPSSWAMMLVGFTGLGFIAARKRRNHGATNIAIAAAERTGVLAPQ